MECAVKINGKDYIPVDSLGDDEYEDGGVRIVVLQRGWVVVGKYARIGPRVTVSKCAVVRRWGTTKGLGELAESGPLANTTLDECPAVSCLESEIVLSMRTNPEKWAGRA